MTPHGPAAHGYNISRVFGGFMFKFKRGGSVDLLAQIIHRIDQLPDSPVVALVGDQDQAGEGG